MAKYAPPAVVELFWVVTVSDYSAITASEINAGADLSTFVRNMPDLPRTANLVDTSTLASKTEFRVPGTRGGDVASPEILRDDATDTAYETLVEDASGYLVLGRKGWTTAGTVTTGDSCDVWPVTIASVADLTPSRNEPDGAVVEMAVTDEPVRNYTIA